jgi:predicted enzyme related to lactoylglutathione lyase
MDWKLELVAVPVSDADRAKAFHVEKVGFTTDRDDQVSEPLRFVQVTPPGSACSIAFGEGISPAQPGTLQGLQVVVTDINAARQHLLDGGVEVSEVEHYPGGDFVHFSDPEGKGAKGSTRPLRARPCHVTLTSRRLG